MRKALVISGAVVLSILALAAIALFILTGTDFGRERVRRLAVDQLNGMVNGIVRIGAIEGNLLDGATLRDLVILDSAGAPFVSAERATVRYSVRDLLGQRIALDDVTLVRPIIILDRPPGGDWNYERIFAGDDESSPDTTLGFGDWISFTDVTVSNGHLIVRIPWEPDDELGPAERDSAAAAVLEGDSRLMVVRAAGGFQQVMEFQEVFAELPRLRIADPDTSTMLVRVAAARLRALPFRPPAADIRDVNGDFLIASDSVYWRDNSAELADSRITAFSGTYEIESGDMWLDMNGEQVALADLRWLYPPIPSEGSGQLRFALVMRGDSSDYVARDATIVSGETRIAGKLGLAMTDSIRFHDTALRFSGLGTRLIEQLAPGVESPRHGTLGGTANLDGTFGNLALQADVTFDDEELGRSHVIASGVVGLGEAFRTEALRVRADPLQVGLVRAVLPDFPLGGTLRGTTRITGSSARWLMAETDLTHTEGAAVSRLTGRGEIALGGRRYVNAELRAAPLALATVGRFAPALQLQGSASGTITARGPFSDVVLAADLRLSDGGALEIAGRTDIASEEPSYDIEASLRLFNANYVVATAPRTSITAVASARGRGVKPATMQAAIALDASTSDFDSVGIDTVHVRAQIADGLVAVEPLELRAGSSVAEMSGTFGLVADRRGTLQYRVQIDSLHEFSRWLVAAEDTVQVPPRPARQARALAQARTDSIRIAKATEVERAAIGGPPPVLVVDSLPALASDSLAGSVLASGTLSGNVQRFEARGRAAATNIVALGNAVEAIRAEYAVARVDTGVPRMALGASLQDVEAGGFAFDSADLRVSYAGGSGTVAMAIHQERLNDYLAQAEFELNLEGNTLRYTDLRLRFDTTTWVSAQPGRVLWGSRGIRLEQVDLRSGDNGRIYVNGLLPTEGEMDVELDLRGVQIAHLVTLLQSDVKAQAVLAVTGRLQGTREAPRLQGALAATNVVYGGVETPDLRTTVAYADGRLVADLIASRGTAPLATAHAEIPLNLAFSATGSRMPDAPIQIELVADSLPLDVLPQFTDAISNLRGRLIGRMRVSGTLKAPVPIGAFALDLGSLHIVASGTTIADVHGTVRVTGDSILIDELNGRTRGDGTIRLRGSIDIASISEPGFDLLIDAEDALLLNNEQGRIYADAGLDVVGPYEGVEIIGGVNIIRGVLYIPEPESRIAISPSDPAIFAVTDTASAFGQELLSEGSPLLDNLVVDVALFITRGTFARSIEANIEIHTPEDPLRIRLDQRRDHVDVLGAVATERGEYQVAGRRFDITRGSALFIGGGDLNPIIQLVGERQIDLVGREALQIRVLIGGTALNPRVTLESNAQPPISQTDLLSYLAFGRSGSSLLQAQGSALSGQGSASGQLVGNVAALATRQLAAVALGAAVQELQTDFARALNADVLNINPADLPAELDVSGIEALVKGTEITAGRYFSAQTFVSTQVRPATGTLLGLHVEQRLPKGYSIEATFEPRYLLREPTLAVQDPARPVRVLGAFLIWERRF